MFYKNTLIVIFKHQEVYFQTLGSLKSAWQRMLKHALSSSPFARKHYKQDEGKAFHFYTTLGYQICY